MLSSVPPPQLGPPPTEGPEVRRHTAPRAATPTLDQRGWVFVGIVGALVVGTTDYGALAWLWLGACAMLFYLAGIYHRLKP